MTGAGIHVKMAQIVAGVLKVPLANVRVAETSTEVVPNTSKTAAAAGTDVNGGAVLQAANTLAERLEPFREALRAKSSAATGVSVRTHAAPPATVFFQRQLSSLLRQAQNNHTW
jgi:xanthine dehydrogenase molybdopterin-binding subunit B